MNKILQLATSGVPPPSLNHEETQRSEGGEGGRERGERKEDRNGGGGEGGQDETMRQQ